MTLASESSQIRVPNTVRQNVRTPLLYDSLDSYAQFLGAIANRKRLEILCILHGGEQSVGRLAQQVELSQSALSQHLAKLRAQRVVATRREGQTIFYSLHCNFTGELLGILEDACANSKR